MTDSATSPRTKTSRQQAISDVLTREAVHSQTQLAELLAADGIDVTQGTLSRDLVELRAEKVRGPGGALIYRLPPDGPLRDPSGGDGDEQLAARLPRLAATLLVSAEASGNLVVVHTPPGAAQYFASALDRSVLPDVLGTVAGDDTVLLVARDADGGDRLRERLLQLASGQRGTTAASDTEPGQSDQATGGPPLTEPAPD